MVRTRVLIVDDDELVAQATGRRLKARSDVTTCSSVREARALIAEGRRFDVILSDVEMPGADGFDLHAALRESHPDQAERVLFMTGADPAGPVGRRLAAAGFMWLTKPFSTAEVDEAFLTVIARLGPARPSSARLRAAPQRPSSPEA